MKVLIITQKVDKEDPILGFFHRWLTAFSQKMEHITVVCLGRSRVVLPKNVSVFSLGKETKPSRVRYVLNFYRYIWHERKNYDVVFVHMNQEYVLLGALLWKILGKKIFLWRNHVRGDFLTRIAVALSDRVFATSPNSFTAQFKKTTIMPAGIDTDFFQHQAGMTRKSGEVLVLSRLSAVKNIELILQGFAALPVSFVNSRATLLIVGDGPEKAKLENVARELNIADKITWRPAVANDETRNYYNVSTISVNTTNSGSLDKTIIEAMSCEQSVLISNTSFTGAIPAECIFAENDPADFARKLHALMALSPTQKAHLGTVLRKYAVDHHSLATLTEKLAHSFVNQTEHRLRLIARYVVVGAIGFAVNIGTLYGLVRGAHVWYLLAGIVAFVISQIVSFILQKLWTFRDRSSGDLHKKFALYSIVGLVNLGANAFLLYFLTDILGVYYILSQVIISIILALWSFFFYKFFVFKSAFLKSTSA